MLSCKKWGLHNVVISPGSRNAPLTIGFTNDPFFTCYSIVDERAAAFFGLGLAQQSGKPTILVCTSGSAVVNYLPAVTEAYFSEIPLVVLSADRPLHKVGIGDGQTIYQAGVFGQHCLFSGVLRGVESNADLEAIPVNQQRIAQAFTVASQQHGPVHLNVPFEEPLYLTEGTYAPELSDLEQTVTTQHEVELERLDEEVMELTFRESENYQTLERAWNSSERKMILVGVLDPGVLDQELLNRFAARKDIVVLSESTSNLHANHFITAIDQAIAPLEKTPEKLECLLPDLLITVGGQVISKKIKKLLRGINGLRHFHIGNTRPLDTYFKLVCHVPAPATEVLALLVVNRPEFQSDLQAQWLSIKLQRIHGHREYLDVIPWSDFTAYQTLLPSIPDGSLLHFGNSSSIRYAQLYEQNPSIHVYCNRGTSGIDGCTSTSIGAAVASGQRTVLITGDIAFFYDSNALWNQYVPADYRMILINNGGGGIFRILPGDKHTDEFQDYFETTHGLEASRLATMYGFGYDRASSDRELKVALSRFYEPSTKPRILEIFTPRMVNDEVLLEYFHFLARNAQG